MSEPPWVQVALLHPEIPPNTGNVGRLCALTRSRLHLIHPLGFTITDRHLRRSGMDYWRKLDLREHESWGAFRAATGTVRTWLFTTHADRGLWETTFAPGDLLLFGNEGSGCPAEVHAAIGSAHSVRIPQFGEGLRSLNLATSVGIAVYEALRQIVGPGRES
jgi:tRNA (cytidine/uridine-2'-O-)-methyltransferase